MKLSDIKIGDSFTTSCTRRSGRLLHLDAGSATVEWYNEDGRTRTIRTTDVEGNKVEKTFSAGSKREAIALLTEVEKVPA
jgi:hypothetical protein